MQETLVSIPLNSGLFKYLFESIVLHAALSFQSLWIQGFLNTQPKQSDNEAAEFQSLWIQGFLNTDKPVWTEAAKACFNPFEFRAF